MQFPKTIGESVDLLYQMRQARLTLQKQVEEIGSKESFLREHIIKRFGKSKLNGARGTLAVCSVERPVVPTITNWDKFIEWVEKNDADDMLYRQVNAKAYRERLDAKIRVPGIEPMVVTKLHLNKVSGKQRRSTKTEEEEDK